jgi:hypothetical protein
VIQTDTDWSGARFIIDDTKDAVRNSHVFRVSSKLAPAQVTALSDLPGNSFITVTDNTTMRYIREGPNQNSGSAQTDVFITGKDGLIDASTPLIWEFNNISSAAAYPIDGETLTLRGGHFTTIANQAEPKYTYYSRGINVTRSNVIIDGAEHIITGELEHGAPYGGFISVWKCADVTVRNCKLSAHKTYSTVGSAGVPVPMGSYDITVESSVNIKFENCTQINDIHDTGLWGIFASNHSKNLVFDTVKFSRFDAHMGVTNAVIKNSLLGHMGVHLIGRGTFILENTKVCGYSLINLRHDYGSTFDGEIIIRNCEFLPRNGTMSDAVLISGGNSGRHNFGYTCYMPKKITIDGLIIHDGNHPDGYAGPKIFADFNRQYTSEEFEKAQEYPYIITEEVGIKNLKIMSGKDYIISNNPFMFRNVKINEL